MNDFHKIFGQQKPLRSASLATFRLQHLGHPCGVRRDCLSFSEVRAEPLIGLRAVLEALQICFEFRRTLRWKAVNHPVRVPSGLDHPVLSEIGELLGNLHLRDVQNLLEMTHAKWPVRQEMDDPQPRDVAEALIDLNEFHGTNMPSLIYTAMCIFIICNMALCLAP